MTRRTYARDDRGQSLIEVALTVPLLLLVIVGIADVGKIYVSKTALTNAAREAAAYAARDPQVSVEDVCQRARDELGLGAGSCTDPDLVITCARGGAACQPATTTPQLYYTGGQGGADVTVTATYRVSLIGGSLLGRAFGSTSIWLVSTAWFPGLSQ